MDGATTDGTGTPIVPSVNVWSNEMEIIVYGTFDSGTVVVEQTPDGGTTWVPLTADITENSREIVKVFNTGEIRANLSGVAAGAASVSVEAYGEPVNIPVAVAAS